MIMIMIMISQAMKQYDGYCAIGPLIAKRNNDCGHRGYHIVSLPGCIYVLNYII